MWLSICYYLPKGHHCLKVFWFELWNITRNGRTMLQRDKVPSFLFIYHVFVFCFSLRNVGFTHLRELVVLLFISEFIILKLLNCDVLESN